MTQTIFAYICLPTAFVTGCAAILWIWWKLNKRP